ncbi:hypothetical protein [Streptomyces cinereoruber]|uniref:hypothetical protein n=1 Tax=Streptomyces cinereoruber TaxID=67260 RepID=UPI00362D8A8A
MSTTLLIDAFVDANLGEQTTLASDVAAAATSITVKSSQGYEVGQTICIGAAGRDGSEKAVVASLPSDTTINLTAGLDLPHSRFDAVVGLFGPQARVYRADNVDGTVPDEGSFSLLATRDLDADQQTTYYRDPDGTSAHWYRVTYYDATRSLETDLGDSPAVRGDDFGHYASISEIRIEAGLEKAYFLRDSDVDHHRRAAESEINATLSVAYDVPFDPVPAEVRTLTIQLAAALLLWSMAKTTEHKQLLDDVRERIQAYANREGTIVDDDGNGLNSSDAVRGYPDANASRMFTVDMEF